MRVTYGGLAQILDAMARSTTNADLRNILVIGSHQCVILDNVQVNKPVRNVGRASLGEVVNVTTGVRYASASKAAKAIGITSAAMSQHLNGKLTHVKGQRFERVSTDA